jgi:competence protein ComFC
LKFIKNVIDFIFPPKCSLCGKLIFGIENEVCNECMSDLPLTYDKPVFPVGEKQDGRKKLYYYCVLAPFYYHGTLREGIIALKFFGRKNTAEFLAKYMADSVAYSPFYKNIDFIVCVPSSKQRKRKRGYNQCFLLSKEIEKILNIKFYPDFIIRKRNANAQSLAKNRNERLKNVKNAFEIINKEAFVDKTVLLVDDVVTTGATLNECARLLKEAGAAKVLCVTAARGKTTISKK